MVEAVDEQALDVGPACVTSLDAIRTASKSKKKPPTTSSREGDARRRREGAAAPRDAEIAPVVVLVRHDHEVAVP